MKQNIVIYNDEGAGEFGVHCLLKFFKNDHVRLAQAPDVLDGSAFDSCDIFVMPGGADLPYCKKLNGAGNKNIRAYVEGGGTYMGICAGAYYACRAIEFHKGRADEICEPRELALIDALAYGSLPEIAPHYDLTLKSAGVADILLSDGRCIRAFYHGGPAFKALNDNAETMARYCALENNPVAIVRHKVGSGFVILSGIHFEADEECLRAHPECSTRGAELGRALSGTTDWKKLLWGDK